MKKAQVYCTIKNAKISPKKVAPVMDVVRGCDLVVAKIALNVDQSKASDLILKALNSAEANAKHNLNLNSSDLYISDLQVSGGMLGKRGRIVAKGRFSPILKRYSHIVVGLSVRENALRERPKSINKVKKEEIITEKDQKVEAKSRRKK